MIGHSEPVTETMALMTKPPALATYQAHQASNQATCWGEGKPRCVFIKYFTKILKVKCLQLFIKDFIVNEKYFTSLITFYMQANI